MLRPADPERVSLEAMLCVRMIGVLAACAACVAMPWPVHAQEGESPSTTEDATPPSIPQLLQAIVADANYEANVALNDRRVEWMTRMRAAETDAERGFEWDIP